MNKEEYVMEIENNPLKDYIKDLLKQLQAYKDKEDNYQNREIKISNMINSHNYLTNNNEALKSMSNYILDILNDKVVE